MGLTGFLKKFPTMNYLANKKIPLGQMEGRRVKRAILRLQQIGLTKIEEKKELLA